MAVVPNLAAGDTVAVKNADVDGIFVAADADLGMFITTYRPARGESAALFTPQRCCELIRAAVGEPIDMQIVDVTPWQPYEQVADQLQCGRRYASA